MTIARNEVTEELENAVLDEAAAVEPGRTSTLAALRYRDFRLFWFGLLVSNVGTWMQLFGLGYLVVQLAIADGVPQLAPLYIGLVGAARAVPGLVLGLFGGAVADRTNRRRLLIVTQTSAGLIATVLAALTATGHINVVEIMLVAALNSVIFAFDAPSRQSMVPRLVDERDLTSAIGLNSATWNGAQLLGPVLGGLIYAPLASIQGPTAAIGDLFFINAVSYFAVVVALIMMAPSPAPERPAGVSMVESIREGLRYVRHERVLFWVLITSGTCALIVRPYVNLLPAVAHDVLGVGAVELSWMLAASGAGALAGGLGIASLGGVRRRGLLYLAAGAAMGVSLMVFSLQRTLVMAIPLLFLNGVTSMIFLGTSTTILQTSAPDHLRGRVMSVQTMLFMGLMPLGSLLLGSVGTALHIDVALLLGGAAFTLVIVYVALRVGAVRGLVGSGGKRGAVRARLE